MSADETPVDGEVLEVGQGESEWVLKVRPEKSPLNDAPTASIVGPDTCFRQIEFVGVLKGTQNRALAEKFVDFMLSKQFQEDMPLQMFVFPVNLDAALPAEFVQYAQIPAQPAELDPAEIAANRERWIADWTDVVLR